MFFVGLDLYDGALRECQIKPDEYKLDDIGEIISLLDSMCGHYCCRIAAYIMEEADSMPV